MINNIYINSMYEISNSMYRLTGNNSIQQQLSETIFCVCRGYGKQWLLSVSHDVVAILQTRRREAKSILWHYNNL
jgi:hypothetical protein